MNVAMNPSLQALPSLAFTYDTYTQGLQLYCVGGAVRDTLLGLPVKDKDWVVVGSSPEEMLSRGFRAVGADFPVFLHPNTQEEYALARTERQIGKGYHGFTFYTGEDVSLSDDLRRRDFTVNAMAVDAHARLYDPYGGFSDLQTGYFRHVSHAFVEDPVRVLRLARFLSRFSNFQVSADTLALCQHMVERGDLWHIVPERLHQELSRALLSASPMRFFQCLDGIGVLPSLLPGITISDDFLQCCSSWSDTVPLTARWAVMAFYSSEPDRLLSAVRSTKAQRLAAQRYAQLQADLPLLQSVTHLPLSAEMANAVLGLCERLDVFRRPEEVLTLLPLLPGVSYTMWASVIERLRSVPIAPIAQAHKGQAVSVLQQAIAKARCQLLTQA